MISRQPPAHETASVAALRSSLLRCFASPGANSSKLLPTLGRFHELDPETQKRLLDEPVLAALRQKVSWLAQGALAQDIGLKEAREAQYSLRLIERELGPLLDEEDRALVETAERQGSAALSRRIDQAVEETNKFLTGTEGEASEAVNDSSRMSYTLVREVRAPRTVAEIAEALQQAHAQNLKVSLSGARHTQGGQIASEHSLHLDMTGFRAMSLDARNNVLAVQSGALWRDIQKFLDAHGKSLDVIQVPNYFTVGGTLGANAHGHNPDSGPVAATVKSLKIMLADGRIVRASREENQELFRLALGGYGLFGVVLEAELLVRDNEIYTPSFHLVDYRDFPRYHQERLAGDPRTRYGHNLLSLSPASFLREIQVIRYRRIADTSKIPPLFEPSLRTALERSISRAVYGLNVLGSWGKRLSWFLLTRVLWPLSQKEQTRNRVMEEPFTHFSTGSDKEAQILQEYFVPRDRLAQFLDKAREVLRSHPLNLVLVSVRAVKKDPDAFLPYAKQDSFGVVFISNHAVSEAEYSRLSSVTRALIEAALSVSGTFYLPYRLVYGMDELRRSYPDIDRFFLLKRAYDPEGRFSNRFYERYGAGAR